MKPYVRKFSENSENYISLPDGFEEVYTGGNIINYQKTLSNGMFVSIGPADDNKPVEGEDNSIILAQNEESFNDGNQTEYKTFKTRAELDAILSTWEKGQIEHVIVTRNEDTYTVDYGDYSGRVVDGPGDNLEVSWDDEAPENWEDIDEAIQHSSIMNLEDGESEEIKI